MNKLFIYVLLGFLLISCDKDDLKTQVEETIVVQGVLIAGGEVCSVKVMTLNNTAFDQNSIGISGAEVILMRGSTEYLLIENSTEKGLYQYSNSDLEIVSGGVYNLEVSYDGKQISASTQVPESLIFDDVGELNIIVDTLSLGSVVFELSWEDLSPYLALVSLDNIEDNPNEIPFLIDTGTFDFFYSKPIQELQASIMDIDFEFYGQNRLTVYSIHPEYERLFLNLNQYNGELSTSGSDNIDGGVGYFTSVNQSSVIINIE